MGSGLPIIVVGCWAVPCQYGALVLGFVIVGWLSIVVVGHGLWVPSLQHVYDLKLMKTVRLLKETRNIKLTWHKQCPSLFGPIFPVGATQIAHLQSGVIQFWHTHSGGVC